MAERRKVGSIWNSGGKERVSRGGKKNYMENRAYDKVVGFTINDNKLTFYSDTSLAKNNKITQKLSFIDSTASFHSIAFSKMQ